MAIKNRPQSGRPDEKPEKEERLTQHPLEHQQQAEAGYSQHAQNEGVDQVDAQRDAYELSHLAEQSQHRQAYRRAGSQTEKTAKGTVEQSQDGQG